MAGGKDPLLLNKAILANGGSIVTEDGTPIVSVDADGDVQVGSGGYAPVFIGSHTWAGSGATSAATVTGVLATDLVIATIRTKPTQAAYLVGVVPTANTITFELSAANTSNDAVITYQVLRAV
jgi:hypothetical protein